MSARSPAATVKLVSAAAHVGVAIAATDAALDRLTSAAVMAERIKELPLQEYYGLVQVAHDALRRAEKLGEELLGHSRRVKVVPTKVEASLWGDEDGPKSQKLVDQAFDQGPNR